MGVKHAGLGSRCVGCLGSEFTLYLLRSWSLRQSTHLCLYNTLDTPISLADIDTLDLVPLSLRYLNRRIAIVSGTPHRCGPVGTRGAQPGRSAAPVRCPVRIMPNVLDVRRKEEQVLNLGNEAADGIHLLLGQSPVPQAGRVWSVLPPPCAAPEQFETREAAAAAAAPSSHGNWGGSLWNGSGLNLGCAMVPG